MDTNAVARLQKITKQHFKRTLTTKGLKNILKDWEKARATPGDLVGPNVARYPRR